MFNDKVVFQNFVILHTLTLLFCRTIKQPRDLCVVRQCHAELPRGAADLGGERIIGDTPAKQITACQALRICGKNWQRHLFFRWRISRIFKTLIRGDAKIDSLQLSRLGIRQQGPPGFVIAPARDWLDGGRHGKRCPTKDVGETCSAAPVKDGKFSDPFKSINASLKSIQRKLNASLDNEREILYYVTDNKENYAAQKDMRRPNSFKEAILHAALDEINKRPLEERRAIALKYFNEFKSYSGFYHDYKTFIRQIDRMRKKSRSNE